MNDKATLVRYICETVRDLVREQSRYRDPSDFSSFYEPPYDDSEQRTAVDFDPVSEGDVFEHGSVSVTAKAVDVDGSEVETRFVATFEMNTEQYLIANGFFDARTDEEHNVESERFDRMFAIWNGASKEQIMQLMSLQFPDARPSEWSGDPSSGILKLRLTMTEIIDVEMYDWETEARRIIDEEIMDFDEKMEIVGELWFIAGPPH